MCFVISSTAITFVPRRECSAKGCVYTGKLGHMSHSPCKMRTCIDKGLAHYNHHRVYKEESSHFDDPYQKSY